MSIISPAALVVMLIGLALSTTAFLVVAGLILPVALASVYDCLRLRRLAEQSRGRASACCYISAKILMKLPAPCCVITRNLRRLEQEEYETC